MEFTLVIQMLPVHRKHKKDTNNTLILTNTLSHNYTFAVVECVLLIVYSKVQHDNVEVLK